MRRTKPQPRVRTTKRRFGDPRLDDPRPPFPRFRDIPTAGEKAKRRDEDWAADDESIAALAQVLGIEPTDEPTAIDVFAASRPEWDIRQFIEVDGEREYLPLDPEVLRWRQHAWYYRRLLVGLGQLVANGFRRPAEPGPQRKWTRQHFEVVLADVERVKLEKELSDKEAVRELCNRGYFTDLGVEAARKLLEQARREIAGSK